MCIAFSKWSSVHGILIRRFAMVKCTYEQSAKRTSSPCYSKYMSSYLKSLRLSYVQVSALKFMALTTYAMLL